MKPEEDGSHKELENPKLAQKWCVAIFIKRGTSLEKRSLV